MITRYVPASVGHSSGFSFRHQRNYHVGAWLHTVALIRVRPITHHFFALVRPKQRFLSNTVTQAVVQGRRDLEKDAGRIVRARHWEDSKFQQRLRYDA